MNSKHEYALKFIRQFYKDHRYGPTLREIGRAINTPSKSSVSAIVNKLVDSGYLEKKKNIVRGLKPLHMSKEKGGGVSFFKHDELVMPTQIVQASMDLNGFFPDKCELFIMNDNALTNVHIYQGDYLLIKEQCVYSMDQLILAEIDEEILVVRKLQAIKKDSIRLATYNKRDKVVSYTSTKIKIRGQVVGQLRRF